MSSSGASGIAAADDVAKMMAELGLREEDLDDVVFDEKAALPEADRCIALERVHTEKSYNQTWFYTNMRPAWDLVRVEKFRPLESNLYTV